MLRVAARRLSSLSSPSCFRPSSSASSVYSTVVSKSPFSEARSTLSASHFYLPVRGFATEHVIPKAEHGISDVPPTGDPSKRPFAYSVLTGVRKAAYLPASVFNSVFMHINTGIEDIVADYVHHEMTRNWILICLRLFFILMIKDVLFSCL